jgi:hypothetical protein
MDILSTYRIYRINLMIWGLLHIEKSEGELLLKKYFPKGGGAANSNGRIIWLKIDWKVFILI